MEAYSVLSNLIKHIRFKSKGMIENDGIITAMLPRLHDASVIVKTFNEGSAQTRP